MLSQAYRLGRITMAIATTMAKKCRDSNRISVRKIRQIFRIIPPLYIVLRSLRNLICTDKITLVLYWFPGKCPSLLGFVSENLQFFLVTRKSGGNDYGGVAFGDILFASSGKKNAKNAAKPRFWGSVPIGGHEVAGNRPDTPIQRPNPFRPKTAFTSKTARFYETFLSRR